MYMYMYVYVCVQGAQVALARLLLDFNDMMYIRSKVVCGA